MVVYLLMGKPALEKLILCKEKVLKKVTQIACIEDYS